MKMKNKIIIHNYTNLSDLEVLQYIEKVIKNGKISERGNGVKQYCFVTKLNKILSKKAYTVTCDSRANGYTFKILEGKRNDN